MLKCCRALADSHGNQVKVYGTGAASGPAPKQNIARQVCSQSLCAPAGSGPVTSNVDAHRIDLADNACAQLAIVLAVCAVALAVCVALISTSELKASRPVALYGLGSGEEQDADNSIVTTFEVCSCVRVSCPLESRGSAQRCCRRRPIWTGNM